MSDIILEKQEVLWSTSPIFLKQSFKQWVASLSLFEKIIISVSMIFPILNLIVSGIDQQFMLLIGIILPVTLVIMFMYQYVKKKKFNNSHYKLTKDNIEIISWSLFGGSKTTLIDLKDIRKTYLMGITEEIGSVLLYCSTHQERSIDLMHGSKLETIAIQYVDDPQGVKEMIDQHRG